MSIHNDKTFVVKDNIVKAEFVEQLEPLHLKATLQIVVPTPNEAIHMIYKSLVGMHQMLMIQTEKLDVLMGKSKELDVHIVNQTIEWTELSMLSEQKGLTKDALRKQLQGGDFEEGVDFKFHGNKIVVHQGAIGRLHRKRRSNNG